MYAVPPLSIAVRADASSAIGTGHIFRCMALTDELRRKGGRAIYVCADAPGNLIGVLEEKGYQVKTIPDALDPDADARATLATLSDEPRFDWLLVDHYGLDSRWERAVQSRARRMVAIDDLANRAHDVDVLFDASHDETQHDLYTGLVASRTYLALGVKYILLRREFADRTPPQRDFGGVRRILVTLGGNDPTNATGLVLDALDAPQFSTIDIDVTLGISNPRLEALKRRAEAMTNVSLHVQSSRMADFMTSADLCVGAGGTTSWERCYMGLPSLILILAENQREIAERLDRLGCGRSLGLSVKHSPASIRGALLDAIADDGWRAATSRCARELVDGHGVNRAVDIIETAGARV